MGSPVGGRAGMQSTELDAAGEVAASERWIAPGELAGFTRSLEATLRTLRSTRLRVSLVAVRAAGVAAPAVAQAVRHALGAQEPMARCAEGSGVVFLYIGPRRSTESDDRPLQRRIGDAVGAALASLGHGAPRIEVRCTHGWTDSVGDGSELLRTG